MLKVCGKLSSHFSVFKEKWFHNHKLVYVINSENAILEIYLSNYYFKDNN